MRLHLLALVALLLGFLAWAAFGRRPDDPSILTARDRLVAGDWLSVRFDPGGVEGYRFIRGPEGAWLWERTAADGRPYPDALIFTGNQHLLRVADGCYVARASVRPPFIPGVTTSQRLVRQPALDERPGDNYAYTTSPNFAAPPDAPRGLPDLEVIENLSLLRGEHLIRATTGVMPDYIWRGAYTIREASPEEQARLRGVLFEARASDYAELLVRERVVGTVVGSVIQEPSSVVVAEDCPGKPARIWSGAAGGQAEGLRATPATFVVTAGDAPMFRNASRTPASNLSQIEYLNDEFARATFGDVPVRQTDSVLISTGNGAGVALRIFSCTARPWFRC